jgi:dolichol-phosphate mannosyltransferase
MTIQVQSLAEWEAAGQPGMLSVVIPARNEEGQIAATVRTLVATLTRAGIVHEVLVVNDNSCDRTEDILQHLSGELPSVRYVNNQPPNGFGFAVRRGLADFRGDAVAIAMADASDSPDDL